MEHKNASIGKRHAPTNWRVLNISELSTLIVGADDVEKTAYVVDDGTGNPTTYVLTNYDPPTWKPTVSGTGGGGGGATWGAILGTITNQADLIAYFQTYGYSKQQIDQFMLGYYTTSQTDSAISVAISNLVASSPNLNGLSDVQIDTPTDKQTLTYNAIAARWENQSVTGITPPAVGVVGADTSTGDNINMQNITDLTFALEANAVYELRAHLTFQSSTTTGYVFGFAAPADSRPSCLFTGGTQITTSANYPHLSAPAAATNSTIAVTAGSVPAANTNVTSVIEGLIQTVNAGTLTLQYRSAAGGTTITLKAGSIAVLERIK